MAGKAKTAIAIMASWFPINLANSSSTNHATDFFGARDKTEGDGAHVYSRQRGLLE